MTSMYCITLQGCDDFTEINVALHDDEVAIIKRIADLLTEASSYGCQPTMEVELVTHNHNKTEETK